MPRQNLQRYPGQRFGRTQFMGRGRGSGRYRGNGGRRTGGKSRLPIAKKSERKITIASIYRDAPGAAAKWELPGLAKLPAIDALTMAPIWWEKKDTSKPPVVVDLMQTGSLIVFDISTDSLVYGSSWANGTTSLISQIQTHWLQVTVCYNVVSQERCGTIALAVIPLGLNEAAIPTSFGSKPYEWVRKMRPSAQMRTKDQQVKVRVNFGSQDAASFRQRVGYMTNEPTTVDNMVARVAIATDATNVSNSAFNDAHSTFVVLVEALFTPREFGIRKLKPEYNLRTSKELPTKEMVKEYQGRWTTSVLTSYGIEDFENLKIDCCHGLTPNNYGT